MSLAPMAHAAEFPPVIALSSLDGAIGFRLDGVAANDWSGSVASAGDVNGDGFADVMVGAPFADLQGYYSGSSYVVFGKASGFASASSLSTLNGSNGFRLDGVAEGDEVGGRVASAGDVNGDGFDDVMVGTSGSDYNGLYSGSGYIVFGKRSGFASALSLSALTGANGFRLDGVAAYDSAATFFASAGDVNGDGFDDVIIGAPHADPHGNDSGSSYVVFGRPPDATVNRVGGSASQYISGGQFNDTIASLGGIDVLEGRGGGDALNGGPRGDTASYAHAPAGVTANLAAPAGNTGDAMGDTYTSVEYLIGSRFADRLTGNGRGNFITGLGEQDRMTGGAGPDIFVLHRPSDSRTGPGRRDKISDFEAGMAATFVDRIDLRRIDARAQVPGNQAFTFIGGNPFTPGVKGQLRVALSPSGTSTIVSGDVNGNAVADFEIELPNFTNLAAITTIDFLR